MRAAARASALLRRGARGAASAPAARPASSAPAARPASAAPAAHPASAVPATRPPSDAPAAAPAACSARDALARQRELEEASVCAAVDRHVRDATRARARGDVSSSRPAVRLIVSWHAPLSLATRRWLESGGVRGVGQEAMNETAARYLRELEPDVLAAVTVHEVLSLLMRSMSGVSVAQLAGAVGNAVRAEINMRKLRVLKAAAEKAQRRLKKETAAAASAASIPGTDEDAPLDSVGFAPSASSAAPRKRQRRRANAKHEKLLKALRTPVGVSAINYAASEADVEDAVWSLRDTILVGTALLDLLLSSAKVEAASAPGARAGGGDQQKLIPAFRHAMIYNPTARKKVGALVLGQTAVQLLLEDTQDMRDFIRPKLQPMVVPPRPWTGPNAGPYLSTPCALVRAFPSPALDDALAAADLTAVYDGLNALGECAWKVNKELLGVALKLWEEKLAVAGLVSRFDLPIPDSSCYYDAEEYSAYLQVQGKLKLDPRSDSSDSGGSARDDSGENDNSEKVALLMQGVRNFRRAKRKAQKTNRELFSLRANTGYQLDQAKAFVDDERIYLPHNVDFRGRAYPIPVYLQHMGADLMRSMLSFASPGVQLGDRGLYWLKIHLANLLGADKMSFDERIAVAEDAIPRAIAAAGDPLADTSLEWWGKAEDPFQLLAACLEFRAAAGRHGGEDAMRSFHSHLPVSMDGSCNGLQHYAALGRDSSGGKQVNLVPSDRPQDVYSGVADLVRKRVDAAAAAGDEIGMLLRGKLTRKLVKQTVMTSVYGVTLLGARAQIEARLREIDGIPEDSTFTASMQLARWTLDSLGDIFSGATATMDWLSASAKAVSRQGAEVQWVTPLGLPVIQPYRKRDIYTVKTAIQRVKIGESGDHMPVARARQQSAFAPNFVHSIDSSHMLMTAVSCRAKGLSFAAVHDSFWTHAAHVDTMNAELRSAFVRLHRRALLVELRDALQRRRPSVRLPPLPERGDLDLDEVLESPYFFS